MRRSQRPVEPLMRCLDRGSGSRGWVAARTAVAQSVSNPWSVAERRFHADLRSAGISGWVANQPIRVAGQVRYPDVKFTDLPLVIEIDGWKHHGTKAAYEDDRYRDGQLVAAGWTVHRFTCKQITETPDWVIATIHATLGRLARTTSLEPATSTAQPTSPPLAGESTPTPVSWWTGGRGDLG